MAGCLAATREGFQSVRKALESILMATGREVSSEAGSKDLFGRIAWRGRLDGDDSRTARSDLVGQSNGTLCSRWGWGREQVGWKEVLG